MTTVINAAAAQQRPGEEVKGMAWHQTPQSFEAALANAWVALPAKANGGAPFAGKLSDIPKNLVAGSVAVPVVVFAHGSSEIVLLPGASHTLFNPPTARGVTKAFLLQVLG